MKLNRVVIKIGGESGQGVNAIGEIVAKSLKNQGYNVFGYREYPSLIKGGYSNYQLDFSSEKINSSVESNYDICLAVSRVAAHKLLKQTKVNGLLIHSVREMDWSEEETLLIQSRGLSIVFINTFELLNELGAKNIMENVLLAGILWQVLRFDFKVIEIL